MLEESSRVKEKYESSQATLLCLSTVRFQDFNISPLDQVTSQPHPLRYPFSSRPPEASFYVGLCSPTDAILLLNTFSGSPFPTEQSCRTHSLSSPTRSYILATPSRQHHVPWTHHSLLGSSVSALHLLSAWKATFCA